MSAFKWLHVSTLVVYRAVTWAVLIGGFTFALAVFGVRYWLLPNAGRYRDSVAHQLSVLTQEQIRIGAMDGYWRGMRPRLALRGVEVIDKSGNTVLKLERLEGSLTWWSLIFRQPRFDSIEIDAPKLGIIRDRAGVITVAGVEVKNVEGGSGFADWLLEEDEIVIRGAEIVWRDELREAPPLELRNVDFRLENSGSHHRFGLRAVPAAELASPFDVRGHLGGRTVGDPSQWKGELFAQLDFIDIAAWRKWIEFPVAFPQGAGALRTWVTLDDGFPTQAVADVQLAQVRTRLADDLAEIDLKSLRGRVGWKLLGQGFEVSASGLAFESGDGGMLQPTDALLRVERGDDRQPARGELHANALDIQPIVNLADRLPWNAELRQEIERFAPAGTLYDVAIKWNGAWPEPAQYSAKARFANLSLKAQGKLPGFKGASGSIDGNEKGGKLALNAQHTLVDLPLVLRQTLKLDTLAAQVGWSKIHDHYEITLNNVSFANEDVAGTMAGDYRTVTDGRGIIDLTGALTRATARSTPTYLPLQIGDKGLEWLDDAFLDGSASDVKLRLKGDLAHFPFADGKNGIFQVSAHVSGATLHYADGWPDIQAISGNLLFRGVRMEISAREGAIFGVKLARVRADIANLEADNRVLKVSGEAEGPTSDFLAFIAQSPVMDYIGRFTEGVQAKGRGRLGLALTIPLKSAKDTQVAGNYQFSNNQIVEDGMPPLDQVNGRLDFTESVVRTQAITMVFLGGPASLTAASGRDAVVRVNWQGRASVENLRKVVSAPWLQSLRGTSDWRATISLRKKVASDMLFESSLQGLASDLPPPLNKAAADVAPLRIEWRTTGANQERLAFSVGNIVAAQLDRRREGERTLVDRGTVSFSAPATQPERKGIWISGNIKTLNVGDWLAFVPGGGAADAYPVGGIDLKINSLDAYGRSFSDLAIKAMAQEGGWQVALASPEMNGDVTWRGQGKGQLVARMKRLALASAPQGKPGEKTPGKVQANDFPALDLVVDDFRLGEKALGRLELDGTPSERGWRIDRLNITNSESTLAIDGLWHAPQSRTDVNAKLQVSDIGKFLLRLGYPEGIKGGTAHLEGLLSWPGSPLDFDYPQLSGNFVIDANKGQFVKLDPGIGKLLGVLSLQALPRRLSLDFRDVFSEGLAFDHIVGAVKVNRGIASAENFRIQSPAVRIQMAGDVDLANETQKLHVKVFPSMSDSLSVAGALLGGPVAGIATYMAQKLLKDPIDKIVAYDYDVAGTWSDPRVSKINARAPQAAVNPD